jgi:hypothetical protein
MTTSERAEIADRISENQMTTIHMFNDKASPQQSLFYLRNVLYRVYPGPIEFPQFAQDI